MKDRKKLIVVATLVAALAVLGVFFLFSFRVSVLPSEPSLRETFALENLSRLSTLSRAEQQDVVAGLVEHGDLLQCAALNHLTIEGVDYQIVCANNIILAEALRDLSTDRCEAVDGVMVQPMVCKKAVIHKLAEKNADPKWCDTLTDSSLKNACWQIEFETELVAAAGSPAVCDHLSNPEEVARCRDMFAIRTLFSTAAASCAEASSTLRPACEEFKRANATVKNSPDLDCAVTKEPGFALACEAVSNLLSSRHQIFTRL